MKKVLIILGIVGIISCNKEVTTTPTKSYSISIDSVLTTDGTRKVPMDVNGYWHVKLDTTINQNIRRVTGRLLVDGKQPNPSEEVSWESNLFWYVNKGDTIAKMSQAYVNYYTGQYTIVNLPYLTANTKGIVPTTNPTTLSGTGGEINTIIAPLSRMKGDTLILKGYHYNSNKFVFARIVLE